MSKSPFRERRFAPPEVRRIVRRAAEFAERDADTASAERALTQEEIERLGGELGLPATAIRRAIAGDAGEAGHAPGPPATRRHIAFDDELDGELSASFDEDLVEAIEAATGNAGRTQVVGRTITWIPAASPTSNPPRELTISVRSRDGKTRLRIDENLTQQFYGTYVGIGFGLGVGIGSIVFGLGMLFEQPLLGIALTLVVLGGSLLLGRATYRRVVARRTSELEALRARLREIVHEGIATTKAPAPRARIGVREAQAEAEVEAEAQAEAEAAAKAPAR